MSGYGYDTETLTLVVILPDGEPVRVVGEHDGVNGFTWSASRGANVLEVRTDHRVLIDGTTEVDPTVDAPHAVVGDDGIVRCSECNSAEFTYQENHPSERRQARNEHGALAFYGDFEWFEGDDDPGVVCANGHTVDTSGIEVDWA